MDPAPVFAAPRLRIGYLPIFAGNLVPLLGALVFGWDLPSILVMYWIETGVIGLVNVLKIRRAAATAGSWALPLVWLAAYAAFWAVLGIFVIQVANGGFYEGASQTDWTGVAPEVVFWGTAALLGGQLLAYVLDYVVGRRYLTVTSLELLRDPFVRILVILATIAVGGVGIAVAGAPIGFLAGMVIAKTVVEAWFYGGWLTARFTLRSSSRL